jgi:hypothetical protein
LEWRPRADAAPVCITSAEEVAIATVEEIAMSRYRLDLVE